MASALTKEMRMMESQLKKWKKTADEALSLREKAQALSVLLDGKVAFYYPVVLCCLRCGFCFHKQKYLCSSIWFVCHYA